MNENAVSDLIRDLIKANEEKHEQYEIKRQKMLAHLRAARDNTFARPKHLYRAWKISKTLTTSN